MKIQRRNYLFRNSFLLALFFFTCRFQGQNIANYVNNGSFEDTINIQNFIIYPKDWGALDSNKYFGLLLRGPTKVPKNSFGFQPAHGGQNIFALSAYSMFNNNNRGYPRNRLKERLMNGHVYCASFFVALTNESTHGIDAIACYFSDETIDTIKKCTDPISYIIPQVTNFNGNILTDTLNWIAISGTFVATGSEKYLLIGNFKSNSNTNTTLTNTVNLPAIFAEYYLDDVSVIDIDLPANAGPDKGCIPGDSVFIGREPDVGIDEACTWYKWPNMAIPIATVAGLYVKPVTTTTYVLRQQLWCSGVKYDTVVVYQDAVGLENLKIKNEELKISPSPATSEIMLSLAKGKLSDYFQSVEILDTQGQLLIAQDITDGETSSTLSIVDLANGIYLLRLRDVKDEKTIVRKLAVQR